MNPGPTGQRAKPPPTPSPSLLSSLLSAPAWGREIPPPQPHPGSGACEREVEASQEFAGSLKDLPGGSEEPGLGPNPALPLPHCVTLGSPSSCHKVGKKPVLSLGGPPGSDPQGAGVI